MQVISCKFWQIFKRNCFAELLWVTASTKCLFKKNSTSPTTCYPQNWFHCVKSTHIQRFFWSVFSLIQTEYGKIRSISPNSIRMQENTYQKLRIRTLFTQCFSFLIYFKYFWSKQRRSLTSNCFQKMYITASE